jgi:L-lactate dehydrogenase complex protein LldF
MKLSPLIRTAEHAASNQRLRLVLKRAALHFQGKRSKGFLSLPDEDTKKRHARDVRLRTLASLPELLIQLEAGVTKAGGTVHWAADAAEARSIVLDIAKQRNVKSVVKGKSMISEEIGLNKALEAEGLEVWETDLGEFIVQLAGEGPSHLIAPAVHMSREDVTRLFAEKLDESSEDIEELTLIARRVLREKFLAADMGITGANMAVAETGSILLLENEGNIRLSTTCPPVHVAIMSLEKVVENLDDVASVLHLLPRSATGQKLSSYASLITGPRRAKEHGAGEQDGPEEFHLVILDNGRSKIAADPQLRETLCCIRCGACLNVCPVYQTIGGHSYGWVYSGPIGALLTSQIGPPEYAASQPHACTTCGACAEICPVGIDHPKLLLKLREQTAGEDTGAALMSASLMSQVASHPTLYRSAFALLRGVDRDMRLMRRLPGMGLLFRFTAKRAMPGLKHPFSKRWPALSRQLKSKQASKQILGGKETNG